MDKLVLVYAVTAIVLQSEVRCEKCVDDVTVNCEMLDSMFDICTVNRKRAAQLCPKTCNMCHPDGNWADWSSWSRCSVTCGSSQHTRSRTCTNPPPPNNGTSCEGASEENKSCLNEPCPVPVAWGPWSEWGTCSSTCDAGIQHRGRLCNRPFSKRNHEKCVGDSTEEQICVQRACTDGGWTRWSTWSTCSATCGVGIHQRTRDCTNPPPSAFGRYCIGPNTELSTCNTQYCPQTAGGWSMWSSWNTCTSSCGGGVHQRHRGCTNPAPSPYGQPCNGLSVDVTTCNKHKCASAHGGWSAWNEWGSCSVTCGVGLRRRDRACDNPWPSSDGHHCSGDNINYEICSERVCATWTNWGSWSSCSDTCGYGLKERYRNCSGTSKLQNSCIGSDVQNVMCKTSCNENRYQLVIPDIHFYARTPATFLVSSGQGIIFTRVEVNVGECYNVASGKFTVSVPGLYAFAVQYCVSPKQNSYIQIVKQGTILQRSLYEGPGNDGYRCMTMQAFTRAAISDQIWVQSAAYSSTLWESSNVFTSFSGVLIHV